MIAPPLHNADDLVNDKYRIQKLVGRGGMGEVYIAKHEGHPDYPTLALKYLKLKDYRPNAEDRFKQEFNTLTHLNHPNITKVYNLEFDDSVHQHFFTSEYIDGDDFLVATSYMEMSEIEDLFVQILRALEYLHGNEVFHFDIKPQNVLVREDSNKKTAKLIDFGLAALGFQGKLVGTPNYISPEMILKNNPDGRSDLYSLGVLMYYVLAKFNPFKGASHEETFSLY